MMHHFVEHTGEVELAIEASSEAGVFEEALVALAELVGPEPGGQPARHIVDVSASDRALLLADWLTEALFLSEVEHFVPERLASIELQGDRVCATVEGRRGRPSHLVKAVTLNSLEFFQRENGAWHGRVVLDV